MSQAQLWKGAFLLTLSCLLFALMGVLIRQISPDVNTQTIVFSRNFIGLILLLPFILKKGKSAIQTHCYHLHLLRAGVGVAAMYCFFYAIATLPLADAMLFTYAAPVFTPLIAYFWLKEAIRAKTYLSVALGFIGVCLALKPSSGVIDSHAFVGLSASILAATAFVSVRRLTKSESTQKIVFFFCLNASIISAFPLLWTWQALSLLQCGYLVAIAMLATSSQLLLSRAYALAPAGQIGPISYSAILYAGLLAWLLWGEVPDTYSILGTTLVVISGLITLNFKPGTAKTSKSAAI
ncbi:MAG TPA: DMT family transporter [Pseudomonadales bacterium]